MKDTLLICSYRDYLINYLNKKFPNARKEDIEDAVQNAIIKSCLLYTSPSPRDRQKSRMPSSA